MEWPPWLPRSSRAREPAKRSGYSFTSARGEYTATAANTKAKSRRDEQRMRAVHRNQRAVKQGLNANAAGVGEWPQASR